MTDNCKILYIEDDSLTRKIVTKILSSKYENIITASNGLEGLKLFEDEHPDIIITDLSMPVMSGFQLVEKIRETGSDVPIVITTAYSHEIEQMQNVTIINKPASRQQILDAVVAGTKKGHQNDALYYLKNY